MSALQKLIDQTKDIEMQLEESGGELTPELERTFNDISGELFSKIDAYGYLIRKMKSNIESMKTLISDMQKSVRAKENNLQHLKDYVVRIMKEYDYPELNGDTCKLRLTSSTAMDVNEEVLLEPYKNKVSSIMKDTLPSWVKVEMNVSKTELKKLLEEGTSLPDGVEVKTNNSVRVY